MASLGKTIIYVAVVGILSLGGLGCTAQQAQTNLDESVKIKLTVDKATVEADKVRADTSLTELEKVKAQAQIYTTAAVDAGLILPEQGAGFLSALDTIANTYLAWSPLGVPKANWLTLVILAYVAIRGKKGK